jgi:hypothetical protein
VIGLTIPIASGLQCSVVGITIHSTSRLRLSGQITKRIEDCRLRIVDLRSEFENEHLRHASAVQKSKFNHLQSAIDPDFRVWIFLRQKTGGAARDAYDFANTCALRAGL